jgi:ATP-dependent exoDNAse (exonuclease V) beta subunit
MQEIRSEYLSASAGSGKTYALSRRFCQLVMSGVSPEEICALTFTRPATREIFSAVIERLLTDETLDGAYPYTRAQALARILAVLPQLQISTIDAFSAKVGRLFAYEVGLDPDFALYDGVESVEGQALVGEMLRRVFSQTADLSLSEVLEHFDIQEEASIAPLSHQWKGFWGHFAPLLESHPEGWGALERINMGDLTRAQKPLAELVKRAHELVDQIVPGPLFSAAALDKLCALLEMYHAEITSVRQWKHLKAMSDSDEERLHNCVVTGVFKMRKEFSVPHELHEVLTELWFDLLARDLEQTACHTRALHRALCLLKTAEQQLTAETGLVSFDGITRALSSTIGGKLSVRNPDAFYVAYRLDSAIRHLMIDEFQDTSTDQWQVLSGVANELATAAEGDGTFFYVGDTKQSIYAWRGGDPTLFADPTRLPDVPAGKPLVESYRSVQTIIDFVNKVMYFNLAACNEKVSWHLETLKVWNERWKAHVSKREGAGFVQMLTLCGTKDEWIVTAAKVIAGRWRELAQAKKKLSIAVMAGTNSVLQGEYGLLRYLREEGVPCAVDGKRYISDTPVGSLVIQLLHWMADPRSTLSREIAKLVGLIPENDPMLLTKWMARVSEAGFAGWLDGLFGEQCAIRERLSGMDLNVLSTVRHALEAVDQQGKTDPAEACAALKLLQVACSADKDVVNLMTVHHSKGLTYDVVFTLVSGAIVNEQNTVYEQTPEWVLERPSLKSTYLCVSALSLARDFRRSARLYDVLCMLYVAITRARYEQIVLASEHDAKSLSYVPGWLYQPFDVEGAPACGGIANAELNLPKTEKQLDPVRSCYRAGDADWWQHLTPERQAPTNWIEPVTWEADFEGETVEVGLPSEHAKARTVADLLGAGGVKSRAFGISLHDQLSRVSWTDTPPEGLFPEVFRKPTTERCELWREHPYSVRLTREGGLRYIAGQFDRVHLFPDSRKAVIYDFKTSREAVVTPAYRKQMTEYRSALAALTGYALEDIRMVLLFTRHHQAVEVIA